jgi:putative oxidoreductase
MKANQHTAALLLRLALGAGFISAVASRLGLWGVHSSGWSAFLQYTAQVNSFVPAGLIPAMAIFSTILESLFGIALILGFKVRYMALGAALLTGLFALAMALSFGVKEPLDYSVFAFSASAFLLATQPASPLSIDRLTTKK